MILLLALLLSPASATRVEVGTVPCPLGGEPTKVHHLASQDAVGGYDSDGARYSSRGQFRRFDVATCPDNYLSLLSRDMSEPLSDAQKEALAPVVEAFRAEIDAPESLRVWDRYALAVRTYRALGEDPMHLARLYLRASWTVRDDAVGFFAGLQGPSATRSLIEAGRVELAKDHPVEDRKKVLFNLAKVAQRGGYGADRDAFLEQLGAHADTFTDAEREAYATLQRVGTLEGRFQDLAIAELEAALADRSTSAADRAEAVYLLGDLHRRRGRVEEALGYYDRAVDDARTPEPMREMAVFLAAELRGERPWESGP